jgi:hypothetical protein
VGSSDRYRSPNQNLGDSNGSENACRLSRLPGDLWYVRPQGQADAELGRESIFSVMLQQPSPNVARGHTHDRVLARVVGRITSEQLYADDPFLQRYEATGYRLLHDVGKELTAAMASLKGLALDYFLEMFVQPGSILRCLHNFCDTSALWGR